jgi:hypothetical protein
MDTFAKLTAAERKPYLEETASRRTSTNTAIEKDFWICWTLKHLFALTGIPELRFKGGTSLSKVFDLIERFSEDIDISLDRSALGFTGERDLANPKLSNTKRKELDLELRAAIEKEVKTNILPKLQKAFESILGKEGWTLAESTEPNEEMTLLFNYPPAFEYKEYLRPSIKIEFGRGDQQPSENISVTPYVAQEFPDIFPDPNAKVPVLKCERTFWEKLTLLHAENHRADLTKFKPRMSRHWSDIAIMSTTERFTELDFALLDVVIAFKKIYFPASWAHYDAAIPGTLLIVPHAALEKLLRDDYKQMREMFPRPPLSFEEIIERLQALQDRINARKNNRHDG